ncbi:MAG: methyltransferase domain-containing protein [Actinobacteria bacterium]|nr:methyltransferase domain-containing protein [Actinomycetota bacterium]
MNICTIIAKNYLAQARVLARSFHEVHPDGNCTVLVIDDPAGYIDPAEEQFELLTIRDIGLPDAEQMAAIYDVMELSTAVKPWLLRTLLARPGVESVSYFDPDIQVFSSLAKIEEEAKAHGIVLTPHFNKPLPRDGRQPAEEDILIAGSYNLGFIGLGAGETADQLLDWWSERLEKDCVNDPANGHFVDQRWIDLAPSFWPDLFLLHETNYNIAYWNLPTRTLEIDGDGYKVDGEPLRFFHFSGYDPRRPDDLSKHQNRIALREHVALARICDAYGDQLRKADYEATREWPYSWDDAANGLKLDRISRDLYREGVEARRLSGTPFEESGAAELTDYLTATVHGTGEAAINRYGTKVWERRQDLRDIFPDIEGASAVAYLEWMREFGPETGASLDLLLGSPRSNGDGADGDDGGDVEEAAIKAGVNVVGYISDERGVGEVARQILGALDSRGIDAAPIDTPAEPAEIEKVLKGIHDADHPYDVNLICVNADMLPAVAAALGPRFFHGHRTAGVWFWEVSDFPRQWLGSFEHLDEVWVATEFIAAALRPVSPIPVKTLRVPVTPLPPADMTRAELGMPDEGSFTFLFVFDYRSVFRRKNPLGLVEAFKRAFEPGEGPSLVIKSIFSEQFPERHDELVEAVADRPEIHLLEDNVSAAAKNAMVASCDCYISLHRSEGLGLTMAEAMYFGKPVIATAYSGNLDFMTPDNSFLVSAPPTKIGPGAAPYDPEAWWADPDLDFAARTMRDVVHDPVVREERARRGAADIRLTHSPQAAADWLETRIAESRARGVIEHLRRPGPATSEPTSKEDFEHLLGLGGLPPVGESGQVRDRVKRAYNRAIRPYAAYQHQVNDSVGRSLEEVRAELKDLRQTFAAMIEATTAREGRINANEERLGVLSSQVSRLTDGAARMEERLRRADDLVDAARTEPYMSDDRLGDREHPLLGKTLGYESAEATGEGYRGFEDLFRGPEEMIRRRQQVYLDIIGDREPVFDAGCGRGEFLDLLSGAGKAFIGVDLDPTMVERCREKGYESVRLADAVEALEETKPGSLGVIFSAQVIEHMPFEALQRFLELGLTRLKPGGLMIAETVNPHSARALKAFWVDPTHQHPLFPEVMLSLCESIGYVSGDVIAPYGTRDWKADRVREGEYAVIATAPR